MAKLRTVIKRAKDEGWYHEIRSEQDERAALEGCYFDREAADHIIGFFGRFLRHSKGRWANEPFDLMEWQAKDVIAPLFGWKRADGMRRFQRGYIEVPKKNGKSTLCAGIALYMLCGDGEAGAEVYSAASDRDQAAIVFNEAASMVNSSPELTNALDVIDSKKRIVYPRMNSFYAVMSKDFAKNEGVNFHCLVFDELHAQRDRRLFDALKYGGAARQQPMMLAITTAGWDRNSIGWEEHDYARKVIDCDVIDPYRFAYIAAMDEDDDWTKEETWRKANPSMGTIISIDQFREDCTEAQAKSSKEAPFLRYRLNHWTRQAKQWIKMNQWDACDGEIVERDLAGRECWGGCDLSHTRDISAVVYVFPPMDKTQKLIVLCRFWIPGENMEDKEAKEHAPYAAWQRAGLVNFTDGNEIDYTAIENQVLEDSKAFELRGLAYDPMFATQFSQTLRTHGINAVKFRQTFTNYNEPCRKLESLLSTAGINHGGNEVLKWMAGNVSLLESTRGNLVMPTKDKDTNKIDGIVALLMGVGLWINDASDGESVYETEGVAIV